MSLYAIPAASGWSGLLDFDSFELYLSNPESLKFMLPHLDTKYESVESLIHSNIIGLNLRFHRVTDWSWEGNVTQGRPVLEKGKGSTAQAVSGVYSIILNETKPTLYTFLNKETNKSVNLKEIKSSADDFRIRVLGDRNQAISESIDEAALN